MTELGLSLTNRALHIVTFETFLARKGFHVCLPQSTNKSERQGKDNIQNVLVSNFGFGKISSIERGFAVLVVYLLELGLAAVAAKNVLFQHNLHSIFLLHLARKANVHLTKR